MCSLSLSAKQRPPRVPVRGPGGRWGRGALAAGPDPAGSAALGQACYLLGLGAYFWKAEIVINLWEL